MGFVNKYIKEKESTYSKSRKIGNFIYSVGSVASNDANINEAIGTARSLALITKTNIDGVVIWEKAYDITKYTFNLSEIIGCDNGDVLVSGYLYDYLYDTLSANPWDGGYILLRIDALGNIIWQKFFYKAFVRNIGPFISLIKIGSESYVFHPGYGAFGYGELNSATIFKIDGSGNIISQKALVYPSTNNSFIINQIVSDNTKIIVRGLHNYNSPSNNVLYEDFILELDFNLNYIKAIDYGFNGLLYGENKLHVANISNILILETKIVILGSLEGTFISVISPNNSSTVLTVNYLDSDYFSRVSSNNDFIYLEKVVYIDEVTSESNITKLNADFNIIWTKKLTQFLSISTLTSEDLTMINYNNTIGLLNLDLESCLTENANSPSITTDDLSIRSISISLAATSFSLTSNYQISALNVSSTVQEICPKINPCSFINRYEKDFESKYYLSKRIGDFVYSIGYSYYLNSNFHHALITKTTKKGELIWEKLYDLVPSRSSYFVNIIAGDNGDVLLSGGSFVEYFSGGLVATSNINLTRIDSFGNVVWCRQFPLIDEYSRLLYPPSIYSYLVKTGDEYETYVFHQGNTTNDIQTEPHDDGNSNKIFIINGNGEILKQKIIENTGGHYKITEIQAGSYGITLRGVFWLASGHFENKDFVLDLDFDLNYIRAYSLQSSLIPNIRLNRVYNSLNAKIIFGYTFVNNFLTIIPNNVSQGSANLKMLPDYDYYHDCFINQDFIYLQKYIGGEGSSTSTQITKLDHSLNIIWTKSINLEDISISTLTNIDMVFTDYHDVIGLLNLNIESCLTTDQIDPIFTDATLNVESKVISLGDDEAGTNNLIVTSQNVNSIVEEICPLDCGAEELLILEESASLQSSHLYLQSTGSQGLDSTKGFHLRWMLKGALGSHLPKGNYATTTANFNKPEDYVKIYRAPYTKIGLQLNLIDEIPSIINDGNALWIYNIIDINDESATPANYVIHFYFRDTVKYNQTRALFNPLINPYGFIQSYGNALIEIETKTQLSFAITTNFSVVNSSGTVKLELLSVEEDKITAPKIVSLRKTYATSSLNNQKLVSENIRSIRFVASNTTIESLEFEFYSVFIKTIDFILLDKYALTKDTQVAFQRLEPQAEIVDNNWLRYNDEAKVNIENYKSKWNASTDLEEQIAYIVNQYITLSDDIDNPMANEIYYFNEGATITDDYDPVLTENFELSNLNVLQISSLDYHVARMLGLGILDTNTSLHQGKYMYIAEYISFGDLQDGKGAREVQHIYCSLPTTINDERLPLPIDIKEIVFGVSYGLDTEAPTILTDAGGYSIDGQTRFLSLFHEPLVDEIVNPSFFNSNREFISANFTEPVYAGIEYRKSGETQWRKPELPHDKNYFNNDATVPSIKANESLPIIIPEPVHPLFVHREKEEGIHHYNSYGINWFSRATRSELNDQVVETIFPKVNLLLPPTNVNALLIREEIPLFLSTASEQVRLRAIPETEPDKTLVRLLFDYNHIQELKDYHKMINGQLVDGYVDVPNNKELFAENIEIFFRNQIPNVISGKVLSVTDDAEEILAIVKTGPYSIISSGSGNEQIIPSFPAGLQGNFVGSILLIDGREFIVHQSYVGSNNYPEFKVFKRDENGALFSLANTVSTTAQELESPPADGIFVMVENMLSSSSWGPNLPMTFKVAIDPQIAIIHQEEVIIVSPDNVNNETHVQKFRGVYDDALIEKFYEEVDENEDGEVDTINGTAVERHLGLYKITFNDVGVLTQHAQFNQNGISVEWYNGIVRLHTLDEPNGERKEFKVIRTENLGYTTNKLILYIIDATFPDKPLAPFDEVNDPTGLTRIQVYKGKLMSESDSVESISQKVNYYPGYKVYLYKDNYSGLTSSAILPAAGEKERYSIFSLRSHDIDNPFYSKLSPPALMFAQEIILPQQPELPIGGQYATRPDFYGKSTYTFNTVFKHKPYAVQFNRASDVQILSAIYDYQQIKDNAGNIIRSTFDKVKVDILKDGNDEYYVNRWNNLLGFDYDYPSTDTFNQDGNFKKYPDTQDGTPLPLPNNPDFIKSINAFIDEHNKFYKDLPSKEPNIISITNLNDVIIHAVNLPDGNIRNLELKVKDFVKDIIHNCFVPLTEIPVIYDYIKTEAIHNYVPIAKKQVVRDRNGNLLKPSDPDFDMAPMMVVKKPNPTSSPIVKENQVQFTDFGLDGASNAKYFYGVREFDLQMKTGEYSPMVGPIRLVNTAPPAAPEIIKIIPVLENRVLGISASIQLEINAYAKSQKVRKINLYRAFTKLDSLSIRTMKLVKIIDLEVENLLDAEQLIFADGFSDLIEVPFADPLFYAITVSRIIEYNDKEGNKIIDYAPSEASKVVLTNIVENYTPKSPILKYASEPIAFNGNVNFITMFWGENVYKGNYHLYKMNSQGNWVEIAQIKADRLINGLYHIYNTDDAGNWVERTNINAIEDVIYMNLELTNLDTNYLKTKSADGSTIYHHFKIITENTSGMYSSEENILSIYNEDSWNDIGGIDDMIIGTTFIIRGDGLGRLALGETFEVQ